MAKEPLPSKVRIAKKSMEYSKAILDLGKFNPSGKGSKAYHEDNYARKKAFVEKFSYLLDKRAKPTKERKYY